MLFGFLEELKSFNEDAVKEVIDEVKAEMFEPESGAYGKSGHNHGHSHSHED